MKQLNNHVYWVGANDWEVRHFHGYELSTHRGTSYNAYLVKDEKNVLIDTVCYPLTDNFLAHLQEVIDVKDIDYIVCNHAEPDHSGALPHLMKLIPNVPIIVSKKGKESLTRHYHEDWNFQVVKTGDKINIGKNELIFIEAPMLHWPDSMFTYLTGDAILFPNDAFGQHYSSSALFNDEVDECEIYEEALKYYANILTPFSPLVKSKIEEVLAFNLPVNMIAPSHGIIWRENPTQIIHKYLEWANGINENRAVILYNSMWGATKKMAESIGTGLDKVDIPYKLYNAATADTNDTITEIFKAKGLIIGSSTINRGILASVHGIMDEFIGLKQTGKFGAAFGSYGWAAEGSKVIERLLSDAKVKVIMDRLDIQFMPNDEDLKKCEEFGKEFGMKLKDS